MSGFYRKARSSTPSTLEANVSPFGWTGAESQSISQIIDYVNQCKGYAGDAATSAGLAKDSEAVVLTYVDEAKAWAGKAQVSYADANLEADRSEQYANQSVDIYNAFLNVAANQRISEVFQLTDGQTVVKFNKVFADAAYIVLNGQRVDGSYLAKDLDYTVTGVSEITLRRSYPAGTMLTATQDIKKDEDPSGVAGESFYVWNRNVIRPLIGVQYSRYSDEDGRILDPRLVFDGYHYLPEFDSTEVVVFTAVPVKNNNGTITIPTNKGDRTFNRAIAEAVPRGDFQSVIDSSIASKMSVTASGTSASRSLSDSLSDSISPLDFGAKGDGVTNDTAAFTELEVSHKGVNIDLSGRTYVVNELPTQNQYHSGKWKIDGKTDGAARVRHTSVNLTGAGRVVFGDDALSSLPLDYNIGDYGSVVAIGYGAHKDTTRVRKSIAIGPMAQGESPCSRDNIAIGEDTLRFVASRTPDYDQAQQQGTRNIAVGGNAGRFIVEGSHNIAIGRNAGQGLGDNKESTVVGSNAAAGYAPIGLSGIIENWAPHDAPNGTTAVGANALNRTTSGYNVAVGQNAARSLVKGRGNVAIGPDAFRDAEKDLAFNGGKKTDLNLNGLYTQVGVTLTLTLNEGHGVSVGDIVGIRLLDGDSQTFQTDVCPASVALVPNTKTLVITHPLSKNSSGTCTVYWKSTGTSPYKSEFNTFVGGTSGFSANNSSENTALGYGAIRDGVGTETDKMKANVAIGFRSLSGWTLPTTCTAVGSDALRFKVDGTVGSGSLVNSTGLGYNTRVSGNDQIQLGNAATTTYVYGTVQNRSDARDKADIEDTNLGINFIMGLRPVDGRWDMRDDYLDIDKEGRVTKVTKDGSRKRNRKHHWFIAQEVKELCDKLGVEFGGYQDHSVNGGSDVLTLGYDEFIPPMTKAIQDCWNRMDELEARIAKLES